MKTSFSAIGSRPSCICISSLLLQLLLLIQQPHSANAQWSLHTYSDGVVGTSFAYDSHRDEFLATGTTYANSFGIFPGGGPRCLVATIENGRLGRFRRDEIRISHRRAIQEPQVCTDAIVLDDPGDAILLGYHPVPVTAIGDTITSVKEMLVTVDYFGETLTLDSTFTIENQPAISYPVATTHDGDVGIFTALHQADQLPVGMVQDATDPLAFILAFKDEATSGNSDIWKPRVQKLNAHTGAIEWSTEIDINGDRVLLSSLLYDTTQRVLFVAGSKKAAGGDWNGFVMKLDGETGNPFVANVASDAAPIVEIASQAGKNDYINCICSDYKNNGGASDSVYVIGTTDGKILDDSVADGGAFVRKLNKSTFAEIWTKQTSGVGIEGSVCAAHSNAVYMGGQVPAIQESGGTDVFMTQFSSLTGDTLWTQQVGSSDRNEHVYQMLIDNDGRPVFAGNSEDRPNGENFLFYIVFNRSDGKNKPEWTRPDDWLSPLQRQGINNDDDYENNNKNKTAIIALSIGIPVLLALLIVCCECRRRSTGKEAVDLHLPEGTPDHDLALEPSIKVDTNNGGGTEFDDDVVTTEPKVV
jgi:hypothetical protein